MINCSVELEFGCSSPLPTRTGYLLLRFPYLLNIPHNFDSKPYLTAGTSNKITVRALNFALLQRAAIDSALSLISDSLASLDNTFQLINSPVSAATILELIEVADKRADDVSRLARRLLNILQNHSEAESDGNGQGVTVESSVMYVCLIQICLTSRVVSMHAPVLSPHHRVCHSSVLKLENLPHQMLSLPHSYSFQTTKTVGTYRCRC